MFIGFNTGLSGLISSKQGLFVAGHNIDNSAREGYSRQLISQEASMALRLPGIGYLGTGTEITNITRARSFFIDTKYWQESAPLGEWEVKDEMLGEIENMLGEVSDTSFRQYLDNFYDALNDMARNPGDSSYREPVLESALSFTKHINDTSKRLEGLKQDTKRELQMNVEKVNQIGQQISLLNRQIYMKEIDGHPANDLRDSRELLVDELSKIVNVRVTESKDGRYDVSIAGSSLVNHYDFKTIGYREDESSGEVSLVWSNGAPVEVQSGKLAGFLDMINGNGKGNNYKGIPYYQGVLSEFSKGFADKINDQHRKGFDLYGEEGIDFFTYDEGQGAGLTITVNSKILKDNKKIAAASTKNPDDTGVNIEDNNNILAILDLRNDKTFFDTDEIKGTPDEFLKSLFSSMAVEAKQTNRFLETQKLLQKNLNQRRQSISGVNINEEVSNIVKYQKTYVASSKIINTMDMLLDLTVNRLGMVGR